MRNCGYDPVVEWRGQPLCRHYTCVIVRSFAMASEGQARHADATVVWAFGCHSGGGMEVLGVWGQTVSSSDVLLQELYVRGVEKIDCLFSDCDLRDQEAGSGIDVQRRARLEDLPSVGLERRAAGWRLLDAADKQLRDIERCLRTAHRRHGRFADAAAALAFVAAQLAREQQRLDQLADVVPTVRMRQTRTTSAVARP